MPWTEVSDVENRWVGPDWPGQPNLVEQLIADAEETIRWEYPEIDDRVVEEGSEPNPLPEQPLPAERFRFVVARMVIRHLRNPDNVRQASETTGPFSSNKTYAGERPGELVLHDRERRMLGYLPGAPTQRAFTIPMGEGQPQGWFNEPDVGLLGGG